jgi:hypothetical protein
MKILVVKRNFQLKPYLMNNLEEIPNGAQKFWKLFM